MSSKISGISKELMEDIFKSLLQETKEFSQNQWEETLSWLNPFRDCPKMRTDKVPFSEVMLHRFGSKEVTDYRLKGEIVLVKTTLHEREVKSWTQPLMTSSQEYFCGLLLKKENGRYYALMQAVEEAGTIGSCQIGPTVQTNIAQAYFKGFSQIYLPLFQNPEERKVLFEVTYSGEGGRFYKDQGHYTAVLASHSEIKNNDPRYQWVSLGTLKKAVLKENILNAHARNFLPLLI